MKRYSALDYLKLILSFLVVVIHIPIFLQIPLLGFEIAGGIARIAVPLFFIINGFFLYPLLDNAGKMKKYLLHLCLVYLVWQIIYLPFSYEPDYKYLIVNFLFGFKHLWYIPALIGGSTLLYIFHRIKIKDKILLPVALILFLAGDFLFRSAPFSFFNITITFKYIRCFLFLGFPFIYLGYYLRKYKLDKIAAYNRTKLFSLTFICLLGLLLEVFLAYKEILPGKYQDFYVMLFPLCPLIFMSVLKISKTVESDGYIGKLASAIYFIHFIFIYILQDSLNLSYDSLYIVIVFFSILASACLIEVNKRLKIFL
jgi:hypothetical protein